MAKAPPAFQFYPGDFVMGTAHLDAEAIGCYLLLLCFQWSHNKLPSKINLLAQICRKSEAEFTPIWEKIKDKFSEDGEGGLLNERLETCRNKGLTTSRNRAQSGRKGGQANASRLLKQKQSKGSMKYEDRSMKIEDRKEKIEEVVAHYKKFHPRSQAGAKESRHIIERLSEGFTVEDLQLAIDGCHVSPFHCGENERGTKYQSLELIVRDASKVTAFIEAAQTNGDERLSEKSRKSLNTISAWLSKKEVSA